MAANLNDFDSDFDPDKFKLIQLSTWREDGSAVANSIEVLRRPNGETRLRWDDLDLERAVKAALREVKKNGVSTRKGRIQKPEDLATARTAGTNDG